MANERTDTKGGTVKVTLVKSPTGFNRNQSTTVTEPRAAAHPPHGRAEGHAGRARHDSQGPSSGRRSSRHLWIYRISNRRRAPSTRRSASAAGQGSGNGKTAGRGHKGAKSRSGFKFKRGFEGGQMPLHRRVPEARVPQPVPGRVRGREPRYAWGAVRRRHGRDARAAPRARPGAPGGSRPVKVLARGEVGKALTVRAHKFSGKAAEKITAAGGTAETIA